VSGSYKPVKFGNPRRSERKGLRSSWVGEERVAGAKRKNSGNNRGKKWRRDSRLTKTNQNSIGKEGAQAASKAYT